MSEEYFKKTYREAQALVTNYRDRPNERELLFTLLEDLRQTAREVLGQDPRITPSSTPADIDRIEYLQVAEMAARADFESPLGYEDFFNLAHTSFNDKLDRGLISFKGRALNYVFLPPDFGEFLHGQGSPVEDPRFDFNTTAALKILFEDNFSHDIHREDVVLFHGNDAGDNGRSYTLIQIPRLQREILVCDKVGEAAFVSHGIRGPIFWATYGKVALSNMEGVQRITRSSSWKERMRSALFSNNDVGQPLPITVPRKDDFKLSADIMLMNALREVIQRLQNELRFGLTDTMDLTAICALIPADRLDEIIKLPTQDNGTVKGLPGQTWSNWNLVVARKTRGFDLDGLSGLSSLFKHFGLKHGNIEVRNRILGAAQNILTTGHHGLTPSPPPELTADFIICALLDHAERSLQNAGAYSFPTDNDNRQVLDYAGQTWSAWRGVIANKSRGFDLDGIGGINHLLNMYQLMYFQKNNTDLIRQAMEHLRQARQRDPNSLDHGLTRLETKPTFSHDYLLIMALRDAEDKMKNSEKLGRAIPEGRNVLPRSADVPIFGMFGYTVRLVNQAMNREHFEYKQDGLKSMIELYRAYGLVGEKGREDRARILEAIKRLNDTNGLEHGLIRQPSRTDTPRPAGQNPREPS